MRRKQSTPIGIVSGSAPIDVGHRRLRGRGSVLLEAAACLQLLAVLAFGIVEVGFAFRDKLTENSSSRGAARVISNAGNAPSADYQGVLALRGALASIPQAQIDRVVIFKADDSGNPTDPTCLRTSVIAQHGVTNACNVYSAAEIFNSAAGDFGSSSNTKCSGTIDSKWCPAGRVRPTTSVPGDNVGIWLSLRYSTKTKLFSFTTITMTDKYVMRVEPEVS
jgi:hypothetical protein